MSAEVGGIGVWYQERSIISLEAPTARRAETKAARLSFPHQLTPNDGSQLLAGALIT